MSCGFPDANLDGTVRQARLRSSFIYLANGVNDLGGNWAALALVLAPLVLLASLCLLPDALNLQHRLAHTFESGLHTVSAGAPGASQVQAPPYGTGTAGPARARSLYYPRWLITGLHLVFALVTLAVNLVVLCALARIQAGVVAAGVVGEAIEVYRRAITLLPAFLWIAILQVLATVVGFVLLVVPAFVVFVWLYFAQYALVFDGRRSWPALLHSRDLMRGRFFKVAMRIVVFLAVWSGYNSWVSGVFIAASILLGPVAVMTGFVWATVFVLDLLGVGVAYATTAFFIAAGVRLYQDLSALAGERAAAASPCAMQPTAPLSGAVA